jgi:hypothetical protein
MLKPFFHIYKSHKPYRRIYTAHAACGGGKGFYRVIGIKHIEIYFGLTAEWPMFCFDVFAKKPQ